jgi:hypothetical protein
VVLEGIITLTTEDDFQILMARGDYGTATQAEMKVLDEDVEIAVGLLNAEEADRFSLTGMQRVEEKESPDNTWKWIIGIALIAIGL